MNDGALHLVNTSIRRLSFFIDENLALATTLFPEVNLIPLILHASCVSIQGIGNHLDGIDSPISHRFKNQIMLMEKCQVGDDWAILQEKSIPALLDPHFELPLPIDAQFVTISPASWRTDYEFIEDYMVFESIFARKIPQVPLRIATDVFSVLFLGVFDFDFALQVLQALPPDRYVAAGLAKAKLVQSVCPEPSFSQLFLPLSSLPVFAMQSLPRAKMLYEQAPTPILKSAIFHLSIDFEAEVPHSLFESRFTQKMPDIDTDDQLIMMDLAASSVVYGRLAERATGDMTDLAARILSRGSQPIINVNLAPNTTVLEFQKRLGIIMSAGLKPSSHLNMFANYLIQITLRYASKISACSLASALFEVDPADFVWEVLTSNSSIASTETELGSLDLLHFIFSQPPVDMSDTKLSELFAREPLPTIAYSRAPSTFMHQLADPRYKRIRAHYEQRDESQLTLPDVEPLLGNEKMSALDDLIYQIDLGTDYVTVLDLIKDTPSDWRVNFLDTYLSMLPSDSLALIPVSQALAYLRPPHSDDGTRSEMKVGQSWDYVIRKLENFDYILNSPEKAVRLCKLHQRIHVIGISITALAEKLAMMVILLRKLMTRSGMIDFLKKHLQKLSIDSLSDAVLGQMVLDLSEIDFPSAKFLATIIPVEVDPKEIHLLELIPHVRSCKLVISYLTNAVIDSDEAEFEMLKFLVSVADYAHTEPIWMILNELTHFQLFFASKQAYSCSDLPALRHLATLYDVSSTYPLFDSLGIASDADLARQMAILGLVQTSTVDIKRTFTSDSLRFRLFDVLSDLSALQVVSTPPIVSLSDKSNFLVVSFAALQAHRLPSDIGPDFGCCAISNVRIDSDYTAIHSRMATSGWPMYQSEEAFRSPLVDALATSKLVPYLDSADIPALLLTLTDNGCAHFILLLMNWLIDRSSEELVIVAGSRVTKKTAPEFVRKLRTALEMVCRLSDDIDPLVLLPPHIIRKGNRAALNDLILVLQHQLEIGPRHLSLFDGSTNKAHIVGQLFVDADFDRGFAIARILHIDINDVMFEAAASFAQQSDVELGSFLLAVIPRLSVESSNLLIEALAPILKSEKSGRLLRRQLIGGIENPQQVLQVSKLFTPIDQWGTMALLNGISGEIPDLMKEAKKQRNPSMARQCQRWLTQYHV